MVKNAAFKSRVMSSSLTMVRGKWYNVISIYELITVPISETKKTKSALRANPPRLPLCVRHHGNWERRTEDQSGNRDPASDGSGA